MRFCEAHHTLRPPPLPCESSRLRSVSADSSHTALRFFGADDLPPNKVARSVLHSVTRRGRRGGSGTGRSGDGVDNDAVDPQ